MSQALAETLGWVRPSARLASTVERAQLRAHEQGAREVLIEHVFAAALEDLDAVYFLARHEIPLEKLEGPKQTPPQPSQSLPMLAPPSYGAPRLLTPQHLAIGACAALRRIGGLASALAESRGLNEVHGGLFLEAILEDGKSDAAAKLKAVHAAVAAETGRRLPPLPGAGHTGAVVAVQAPHKPEPKPQQAPRRQGLSALEQVRWMKEQIARALEQERPYRFLQELNAFADKDRPFASMAALELRDEAQFQLAQNPVFRAHGELLSVERALQDAEALVRRAAVNIAEVKPHIFQGLLSLVSDAGAASLKAALETRIKERAAMAAAQQALREEEEERKAEAELSPTPAHDWSDNVIVQRPLALQSPAEPEPAKKSTPRFGRFWAAASSARAAMMNLLA